MAEMCAMDCPRCRAASQPLAVVDGIMEYRCHGCGLVFYKPCGCPERPAEAGRAAKAADEHRMATVLATETGPRTYEHRGCS